MFNYNYLKKDLIQKKNDIPNFIVWISQNKVWPKWFAITEIKY